ncbi:MAG: hypothetical protein VB674_04710 [Vicinamibacterales bacterium]
MLTSKSFHSVGNISLVSVLGLFLVVSAPVLGQQSSTSASKEYFVSVDAGPNGDGSRQHPFLLLSQVESVSAAGDTIYLLSSENGKVLDGGIALKVRQRLIGLGADGEISENTTGRVKLTNTADLPGGVMVQLSEQNEVAGIHFMNMGNAAISGAGTNYSGTYIHHTTFSGNGETHVEDDYLSTEGKGLVYAISLEATSGELDGIRIEDSTFSDGEDLGAIRVFHSGESRGNYRFQRNDFSDLGGRAYFVRTQDRSYVETVILDSTADNIGRGERNSDSIIPYLMGASEQVMLIRNYRFQNTKQEGNGSNTGIEAYIFGEPRPDEANWCNGCKLTLKIFDSVIENAVTDPIQFSNSGRNSDLLYEIRNTRVIGGDPQQGDGGISLNLQSVPASGGRTKLLVEHSDIISTTGYGFSLNDRGGEGGHAVVVDLGGGVLGSLGRNRFVGNEKGAMRVSQSRITAANNWWDGGKPTIYDGEDRPADDRNVLVEPVLSEDPR